MSERVLIVDDEEVVRRTLARMLQRASFEVFTAADPSSALASLEEQEVAVALVDLNLAHESGLDLIAHLHRERPDLALVMISGCDDPGLADVALGFGAFGYLVKPVSRAQLVITVRNALLRRGLEIEHRLHQVYLEDAVRERTGELSATLARLRATQGQLETAYTDTIFRLAAAAEARDGTTGAHLLRMSRFVEMLMVQLGTAPDRVRLVGNAARMHDIGKIGIPDRILLSPDRFSPPERAVMEQHAQIGHRILSGSGSEVLKLAAKIALTHHERFDGTGYPRGLAGEAIPLEGRASAIADVFDALISRRPYKDAWPVERAIEYLITNRGSQFDPVLVDVFTRSAASVAEIVGLSPVSQVA